MIKKIKQNNKNKNYREGEKQAGQGRVQQVQQHTFSHRKRQRRVISAYFFRRAC